MPAKEFLPTTRAEMTARGWDQLDILLITGDAYVDHPAFGAAMLGRCLEAAGYRVGIVAQPRWTTTDDVARMGRPRLFAGVTAGALDSMLAHYTAFRKKRSDDAYTPGGRAGARPNRATIVYASLVKQAFKGLPIVLGGVEASMRRATHYDFWTDKLRAPIVRDAKATLLLYGMAERSILATAELFKSSAESPQARSERSGDRGTPSADLAAIPGAAFMGHLEDIPPGAQVIHLPAHEELLCDPKKLMTAALALEQHVHAADAWAVQPIEGRYLILTPPGRPQSTEELDRLYALPFTRRAHPSYTQPIPAADMIRFSITSHRGCAGGCSFCSLAIHQGRRVRSRSTASIHAELRALSADPKWTGSISDIGGPTANMWSARCTIDARGCTRASCLQPSICPNFRCDQAAIAEMLDAVAAAAAVKHVRVASGVRFDLALQCPQYVEALVGRYVGGQLKIAPEHLCDRVLTLMRKPTRHVFERFLTIFENESKKAGKQQFVIPYLMSAFPGCTDRDMRELADWLKRRHWKPQQVQCFIPLPGTVAAAMYYAGIAPDGREIPVARTDAARLRQHYLLAPSDGDPPRRGKRR